MNIKKILIALVGLFLVSISSFAQNTFPSSGKVGIGTTSPSNQLHISDYNPFFQLDKHSGNYESGILFSRDGTPFFMILNDNGTDALNIYAYGLSGETETVPRVQYPLTSKDIYMALSGGKVGIGTIAPDERLTVKGKVHAQEVKVDLSGPIAPDYVFEKSYALPTLHEVKSYIDQNKHLPEVPSAKEMEANGLNLGQMNMLLLKKVEELTLYMIQLQQKNEEMEKRLRTVEENR